MLNIGFEVAGLLLCVFAYKKFDLAKPQRRREFFRRGTLPQ
jgi:hypothetical protein